MTVTEWDPPPSNDIGPQNDIELRLGADLVHLPVIRSMAASIATRADYDLDAIADLRLAVDEACSTLITMAAPGSIMLCRFTTTGDELRFSGTAVSAQATAPSTGTFGWRVLTTLTDTADTWITPNDQGHLLHIELCKRRQAVDA
ncbi:ATP-binding protein [Amycolatopsis anabasis]|uniref:ATP-binding protein n=1 Tax=Amycolatopsis anabasis TaxID=1840409 RepID=UPI00131BF9D5|nr:ATP-binding protein [Amycolatopsis anabasis]